MSDMSAGDGLAISQRPATERIHLVRLAGSLTAESASVLAGWVEQVCGDHIRAIHVDVGRLEYIDDTGAWTLALAFQCVRFRGHPVSVYNVPFPLRCILDAVLTKSADPPCPPVEATSAPPAGRGDPGTVAADSASRDWLAVDRRICGDDPQLASMFLIFDQLSNNQGPPGKAVLSSTWDLPSQP
ncbi:MAG TPA: STAS domain-containing protein [Streptosporangiaceae bacterium]